MTIKYINEIDFYNGIHNLVSRALHFNADYDNLTITLTGAF